MMPILPIYFSTFGQLSIDVSCNVSCGWGAFEFVIILQMELFDAITGHCLLTKQYT